MLVTKSWHEKTNNFANDAVIELDFETMIQTGFSRKDPPIFWNLTKFQRDMNFEFSNWLWMYAYSISLKSYGISDFKDIKFKLLKALKQNMWHIAILSTHPMFSLLFLCLCSLALWKKEKETSKGDNIIIKRKFLCKDKKAHQQIFICIVDFDVIFHLFIQYKHLCYGLEATMFCFKSMPKLPKSLKYIQLYNDFEI